MAFFINQNFSKIYAKKINQFLLEKNNAEKNSVNKNEKIIVIFAHFEEKRKFIIIMSEVRDYN